MDWLSRLSAAPHQLGDGVEVYSWNYSAHLRDNLPHRHTFFEICLVGAWGAGLFTVENEARPIQSGDLFIARPGVLHRICNTETPLMELFWVCFDWVAASQNATSETATSETAALFRALADSPRTIVASDGVIPQLWQTLRAVAGADEHAAKDAQLAALQRALLWQIAAVGAGQNAPHAAAPAPPPHRLARLGARYIHDNLSRRLCVAEIAAHLHLSPRQFTRLFTAFAGTSPAAYIEQARIQRARHLLRDGESAIKTIALRVGYPDVHHFTRVFGRCCGTSPAAYRRGEGTDVSIVHKDGALV